MGCRLNSYRCRLADETTFTINRPQNRLRWKRTLGLGDTSSSRELIYFRKRSFGPPLHGPAFREVAGGYNGKNILPRVSSCPQCRCSRLPADDVIHVHHASIAPPPKQQLCSSSPSRFPSIHQGALLP